MFFLLILSKSFLCTLCAFDVCLPLSSAESYLVKFQPLAQSCECYRKLEFCVTSFCFFYHQLWRSSCHLMLALFLLYVFLVWIISWCDLFQVTGTNASCALYIICSQFITFEQATLYSAYCVWFVALLASPYTVLLRACPHLPLAQFDSSVYIRIQFGLPMTCAKLALRTVIMSFRRCLSLLLRLKVIASI